MSQNKTRTVWSSFEPILREALENYVEDHNTNISEFIRSVVTQRLIKEGYVIAETMEAILV